MRFVQPTGDQKQRIDCRSGFAMIEVLVTIVVIAVGALGLAGLQLSAMKFNKESAIRSKATLLTIEISDRMRANMAGLKAGSYTKDNGYTAAVAALTALGTTFPNCSATDCTSAEMAKLDLMDWRTSILAALPEGTGAIVPIANTTFAFDIVVMWKEKSLVDSGSTDSNCKSPLVAGVRCVRTTFIP